MLMPGPQRSLRLNCFLTAEGAEDAQDCNTINTSLLRFSWPPL